MRRLPSGLPHNFIESTHVRAKGLRNFDGAVGLLVVLKNREPGAAYGQAATVDGVHKLRLGLGAALSGTRPVTDIRPPCLKGVEVGAGGDFAVKILAGQPDFEIES